MSGEMAFYLADGERLLGESELVFYTRTSSSRISGSVVGGSGSLLLGGMTTSKQQTFGMSHLYLTNDRIVLISSKVSLMSGQENVVGRLVDEIPLVSIRNIQSSRKHGNRTVEISALSPSESADNIEIELLPMRSNHDRSEERDRLIQLVQGARARSKTPGTPAAAMENPLRILKARHAKGEISRQEYDTMTKELSG